MNNPQKVQKILLVGLGSEALSSFAYLQDLQNWNSQDLAKSPDSVSQSVQIWIADEKPLEKLNPVWREALKSKKITDFILLPKQPQQLKDQHFDVIIKTPGIPLHKISEMYGLKAEKITSNTQLFFDEVQKMKPDLSTVQSKNKITTIGVTGTKGKSTTAAVLHAGLSTAKPENTTVLLGGNIGTPPLDLLAQIRQINQKSNTEVAHTFWIVLELSCHQLAELTVSPEIAVVQKITPEHQDYYRSVDEYVESKTSICKYQKPGNTVFYFDDGAYASRVGQQGAGEKIAFTIENLYELEKRVGQVLVRDAFDTDHPEARLRIAGKHNLINIIPALLVSEKLGLEVVRAADAARAFPGLPHRLQSVGSATVKVKQSNKKIKQINKKVKQPNKKVKQPNTPEPDLQAITLNFYNDSLATTPESAAAAIASFPTNSVHLIAGGHERNLSFKPLAQAILKHQVKTVFLFQPTGTRIEQAIRDLYEQNNQNQTLPAFIKVNSMADVFSSLQNLENHLKTNDTVLLSPGAPSFGVFKDYRDRGDQFTQQVHKLSK